MQKSNCLTRYIYLIMFRIDIEKMVNYDCFTLYL